MNLALTLGVLSILITGGFALWMFLTRAKRKYQPGLPLAGGAFVASAIVQSVWVYERWHGIPVPPLVDCMWSLISVSLVFSFALLLNQLGKSREQN